MMGLWSLRFRDFAKIGSEFPPCHLRPWAPPGIASCMTLEPNIEAEIIANHHNIIP